MDFLRGGRAIFVVGIGIYLDLVHDFSLIHISDMTQRSSFDTTTMRIRIIIMMMWTFFSVFLYLFLLLSSSRSVLESIGTLWLNSVRRISHVPIIYQLPRYLELSVAAIVCAASAEPSPPVAHPPHRSMVYWNVKMTVMRKK